MSNGTPSYTMNREINDGIERISYIPEVKKHKTPLLFIHGMWHAAWCWQEWQTLLAEWGWESHAISLPGHGDSPAQGSVRWSTMQKYLKIVSQEVNRFDTKPVLIGHSMGGALTQWYLKKIADDLPAAVLVAAWTSHSTIADGTLGHLKRDPIGFMSMAFYTSSGLIRNPKVASSMLTTKECLYTPKQLWEKLEPESGLVLMQHNPPLWSPLKNPKTPMLSIAGETDAVITLEGSKKSADFYGADFIEVKGGGHNLMMEKSYKETVRKLSDWLEGKVS